MNVIRFRRVRWKIMLPFVVLTALFAYFATQNITQLVTSSLEDRLDTQLVSASQYTADAIAKRERDHLEVVRTVANTEGVAFAVSLRNTTSAQGLILPAAVNAGIEHVQVFALDGRSVFGVEQSAGGDVRVLGDQGSVPVGWSAVSRVLSGELDARGDKWAQVVQGPRGPVLLTAGPIKNADNKVVGAVAVSSSLSSLLLDIKRNAFADVTVFGPAGGPLSSTFDLADATEENHDLRGTAAATSAGSGGQGQVLGRTYQFLNSDLQVRGETIGSVAIALSTDAVASTGQSTRLRMSLIFSAITLGVIAIGWFVARQLTRPLSRLVAAAVAVSGGDLSARSNVRTSDEIGVLGLSFDSMAERLEVQHLATIGALATAIDARDRYTAGHSIRVGDLSAELGIAMGMPKPAIHHLRVGGLLHDIGKIGVPDTILLKPGALTAEERRLIELHPTIGLRILEGAHLPREVLEIVGGHHERLNGTGYPLGLSEDEISMFPRLTAVADVYDAITTDRPYRSGLSPQEAIRTLSREAEGGALDKEAVATMRRIARLWEERRASSGVQSKAWLDSLQTIGGDRPHVA